VLDKVNDRLAETLNRSSALVNEYALDLTVAGEAALGGGRAAMPFYGAGDLDVSSATGGPVTNADRASHRAITEHLRSSRCADRLLSEEGDAPDTGMDQGRTWVVDPLDGTREFIDRIGEFSVMVGLAVDGRAILGAVYRPDPDVLYLGIADEAAWRVDSASSEPRVASLHLEEGAGNGLRFVRSRSHPDERLQALEQSIDPAQIILSGSVGTKCALIADGRADLYVHPVPYLKEWDTCAPEAVLRGAGGRVTDCQGDPLNYGKLNPAQPRGIFAARPEIWTRVAEIVFHNGKDL
jgi:3'(2'), 5'-bisphosphate nucleotidase